MGTTHNVNMFSKKCPYCRHKFDQAPKRSRKCESCGERFFVEQGEPITLKEKRIRWLHTRLQWYGITKKDVKVMFEKAPEKSDDDLYWALSQQRILELRSQKETKKSCEDLWNLYQNLAGMLYEQGKPHEHLQKLADEFADKHLEFELRSM